MQKEKDKDVILFLRLQLESPEVPFIEFTEMLFQFCL